MEQNISSSGYSSIDELLMEKYGHTDVSKMDFPDLRNKTIAVDKRGRTIGKILSYPQAEKMVQKFLNMPLP